jgi:hypothetical protein
LTPNNANLFNLIAWLKATCPDANHRDGRIAVDMATRACELTNWQDAASLDTLAAAYAEVGDFDQALKYQNQVLQLPFDEEANGEDVREHLRLYEAGKPIRDTKKDE